MCQRPDPERERGRGRGLERADDGRERAPTYDCSMQGRCRRRRRRRRRRPRRLGDLEPAMDAGDGRCGKPLCTTRLRTDTLGARNRMHANAAGPGARRVGADADGGGDASWRALYPNLAHPATRRSARRRPRPLPFHVRIQSHAELKVSWRVSKSPPKPLPRRSSIPCMSLCSSSSAESSLSSSTPRSNAADASTQRSECTSVILM